MAVEAVSTAAVVVSTAVVVVSTAVVVVSTAVVVDMAAVAVTGSPADSGPDDSCPLLYLARLGSTPPGASMTP